MCFFAFLTNIRLAGKKFASDKHSSLFCCKIVKFFCLSLPLTLLQSKLECLSMTSLFRIVRLEPLGVCPIAFLRNIRLTRKNLPVTNTLAYFVATL